MSWNEFVKNLMVLKKDGGAKEDAAIVGCVEAQQSVWAAHGNLKSVTPDEVRRLVSTERNGLFENGPVVAGEKCRLIKDFLHQDEGYMILQTKNGNRNMVIAKSATALVMLKGGENVHARMLIDDATEMAKYLKDTCQM